MSRKVEDIEEVWGRFKDFEHVFLATMDDDQPRVRPVTLIHFDERFWVTTDTRSEKVKQIQKNPKVEVCLLFQEGDENRCIRVSGMAKVVNDRETRTNIARHCEFFSKHWKSVDDPDYTLLEIRPEEVQYVTAEKITRMKV